MTVKFRTLAAAASFAIALVATSAFAGKNDYVFEPVSVDVKNGNGSRLAVRLVHKPSGKPVEGAVSADLTMAGRWALKLMAKVPGESETIEGTVIFKAK
jgi:hypothetical protein